MAETHITRCPHCQTTFRIRLEQLAKAKGAVRCGSCLQVFKAGDHLVSNNPNLSEPAVSAKSQATAKPTIKPAATVKAKSEEVSFDDIPDQINDDPLEDFGIRQPERKSGETFESNLQLDDSIFSMQEKTKPSRYSVLDQDRTIDFESNFKSDIFSNTDSDESWASDLIDDESKSSLKSADYDESWADALLDMEDDINENSDLNSSKTNTTKEKDNFVPSLEDEPEVDQFHLGGDNYFEQESVEIELTVASSVNDLLDEPLDLAHKSKKKPPKVKGSSYTWLWLTGALLMMFAMMTQIAYFKFDSWSRHPDYRSSYAMICQLADCQLPAVQDITQMNTQHFMVRLHPDVKKALYIDTLLINHADYQQPFPDLNLVFTGLENQVIASRRFKPKEYLAGELAGATEMPLNVPIHIAFEIMNPGAEAVSYRIEIAANH
jgi:predicted Zn finger-like uncharacterized protein